ncbi:Phage-related tail protein [Paramagnetospirillum magnetotacticum MS-1]|uniref:Phage-related tail protein n=1 Tax=Paramagnetospirillum magnetotacticum MS-1 TaxID=272627 RepID=A0A0C2YXF8_PARME|nr:hypothetical protein [Paramagnetospirillum magnetotacticum]KIL99385.1 Phage-related tail protein [Paramagnetospirillum magnetotacticum MS-1]
MRKLLIGAGVVVTVIIGAAVFLLSSLDSIVKKVIEDVGSQVTGVKVSVGAVKISLSEGKGSIAGLTVANPPGFSSDPAIRLGEIALALDTGSLNKNPIVVKDITVASPFVAYEMASGGSNIDAIQKNVKAFTAKHGGSDAKAEPAKTASKDEEKKLVIERLAITGGQVKLAAGGIPGAEGTAKLGDIVLTNIGKDSGGASSAQVAQKVMDSLVNGALKSATSFGNLLGGVGDKAKALVPGDAAGAVKGLFGK